MKLTPKEEAFCQAIARGETQYAAYIEAYPAAKKWKRNAVDSKAAKMFYKEKIRQRISELKKKNEDILEQHRAELIQLAVDMAKGKKKDGNPTILAKLLDKLLPTKTENKNENYEMSFEDFLRKLQNDEQLEHRKN